MQTARAHAKRGLGIQAVQQVCDACVESLETRDSRRHAHRGVPGISGSLNSALMFLNAPVMLNLLKLCYLAPHVPCPQLYPSALCSSLDAVPAPAEAASHQCRLIVLFQPTICAGGLDDGRRSWNNAHISTPVSPAHTGTLTYAHTSSLSSECLAHADGCPMEWTRL